MTLLPTTSGAELATKQDLRDLEYRLDAKLDRRFEGVDLRFERIDLRFEGVDLRFERLDERLGPNLDYRLEAMEHRIIGAFRGELVTAITSQTRSLLLGIIGSGLSMGGLVLAAARVL